jgi:hypothetical protein
VCEHTASVLFTGRQKRSDLARLGIELSLNSKVRALGFTGASTYAPGDLESSGQKDSFRALPATATKTLLPGKKANAGPRPRAP